MESTYDQLIEMGFEKLKVEKAIKFTNNEGLQSAIDWLVSHEIEDEKLDEDMPSSSINQSTPCIEDNIEGDSKITAKSMKCDDCGKLLLTDMDVQLHASRVGHINFSESIEEIKPLTEEDKKIQMEKLQEKLKQKRLEREAREAQENLERERCRRRQGKTIIDAKTKFEEEEFKRLADQKRREKEEDRLYREKLKLKIAQDREARKQNIDSGPNNTASLAPEIKNQPVSMPVVTGNFDTCRIQIRSSQGAPIVETFSANDSLFEVAKVYAEKSRLCSVHEVEFRTTMPPKLYGAEFMSKSVKELGFCPSIVLMAVAKKSTQN